MRALIGRMRIGSDSRLLQTSSLNFDMSVFEIFSTLIAGACLVVPEPAEAADPQRLLDLVHRSRVTVWSSTPALFKATLDAAMESPLGLPECLRTVIIGGDRFPMSVPGNLATLAPWCRIYNVAGMAEVSFASTLHLVRPQDAERSSIPWGTTLANQRTYVLDRHGEPAP